MKGKLPARILMTADTVGGVWTYALDLSSALELRGIQVMLATMGARPTAQQRAQVSKNVGLCESDYKLEWMESPWEDVAAAGEWLLGLEKEFCPDLIHLNGYAHGALPWRAPKLVVAHSCVLSWWRAVKGEDAPPEWDVYRRTVKAGMAAADLVVTPSGAMLSALKEFYGRIRKARVIPNGRAKGRRTPVGDGFGVPALAGSLGQITGASSDSSAGQSKGVLPAKPETPNERRSRKEHFILSAGRVWDEAKNMRTLAEVAPSLSWPVVIAGEARSPMANSSEVFDKRASTGDTRHGEAHYLGNLPREELSVWFERAAIYALPARYEPFGLSILEAASAGCALVLGDIPSLREIWLDAAVYVPPNDSRALRRELELLTHDERRREEMGRKASTRAADFSLERMARSYLAAYSDLLQSRPDSEREQIEQETVCAF